MPIETSIQLDLLLPAIKSPIRWRMLGAMTSGEPMSIKELAAQGGVSYFSAIKHIEVLKAAGLLAVYKSRLYKLTPPCVMDAEAGTIDFGHLLARFR